MLPLKSFRLILLVVAAASGPAESVAQATDEQKADKEYQDLQQLIGSKRAQEHRDWEATKSRIEGSTFFSTDAGSTAVTSSAATARSGGFPDNASSVPYAQWSEGQKTALARALKDKSSQDCAGYEHLAAQGVMRASYEAAACMYKTYYLGTPADYPGRQQLKQGFYDSAQKARQFNSTAPVIQSGL